MATVRAIVGRKGYMRPEYIELDRSNQRRRTRIVGQKTIMGYLWANVRQTMFAVQHPTKELFGGVPRIIRFAEENNAVLYIFAIADSCFMNREELQPYYEWFSPELRNKIIKRNANDIACMERLNVVAPTRDDTDSSADEDTVDYY